MKSGSATLIETLQEAVNLWRLGHCHSALETLDRAIAQAPEPVSRTGILQVLRLRMLEVLNRRNDDGAQLPGRLSQPSPPAGGIVHPVTREVNATKGDELEAALGAALMVCTQLLERQEQYTAHSSALKTIAFDAEWGALELSKPDLTDLTQIAEEAYAQGLYKQALEHFKEALALCPYNFDLQAAIARCLRQLGDFGSSEIQLKVVLNRQPGQFAATLGMAELEMARDRADAAIPWYRAALAIQPGNAMICHALIQALIRAGDDVGAEELLVVSLGSNPQDLSLLTARIELLAGRGALEEALDASRTLLAHPEANGWQRLRHVDLLRQLGRHQDALEVLKDFEAVSDATLFAHGLQARGVVLRELGRFNESLELLQKAVKSDPTCPDHAVALASLLAEIGAFEEGLDMLQEVERRVAEVHGLTSQPWLQIAKVILLRGSGERESALSIADGLSHDPCVGFHARVQRAELLITNADPRAEDAINALQPVGSDQLRQEHLSRSEWLRSQYRFEEAFVPLAPLLQSEPLDVLAAERACLLKVLVMDLQSAQQLFQRIRTAKQASSNPRVVETAFHGLHRCLMEEYRSNLEATEYIRSLAPELPITKLGPLARLLREEPNCSAAAISLLIAARQSGRLEAWASPPKDNLDVMQIPREVVQFWDSHPVPDGLRSLMQSWLEFNPAFRHYIIDHATAKAFIELHSTQLAREAFNAALHPVLQSDLFRLAWLYECGGIYADADDRCRHSLEPLLMGGSSLVLLQEDIGSIGNNFIAACPRHPFIAKVLELAACNVLKEQASNPWFLTGPGVFTQVFASCYAEFLSNPDAPRPEGLRLLTQHELNRRISMHLQTPVKVKQGNWSAPRGRRSQTQRLILPSTRRTT